MRMMTRGSSRRSSFSRRNSTNSNNSSGSTTTSRRLSFRRTATVTTSGASAKDKQNNKFEREENTNDNEKRETEEKKREEDEEEVTKEDRRDVDEEEGDDALIIQEIVSVFDFDSKLESKFRQVYQQLVVDDELLLVASTESDDPDPKHHAWEIARYVSEFRKLSTPRIVRLYKNRIDWRRDNQMETFVARYGIPSAVFQYLPLYLLEDLDYDGNPLYVARIGAFDAWGMYQRVGCDLETFLDYTKFLQEITTTRLFRSSATHKIRDDVFHWQTNWYEPKFTGSQGNQRRRLSQFTMLVDLEGLSSRKHLRPALFALFGAVARVGQDYYAGYARRIILLRAPRIFQLAWNFVRHFLDPHIIDLIKVTTCADYLEVCDQYLNRKSLPACIAPGEGEGRPIPNSFFECIRMDGGTIPPHITLDTPCTHPAVPPNAKVGSPWPTTATTTTVTSTTAEEEEDPPKKPLSASTAITATLSASSSSDDSDSCVHDDRQATHNNESDDNNNNNNNNNNRRAVLLNHHTTTTTKKNQSYCRSSKKLLSGHLDDFLTNAAANNINAADDDDVVQEIFSCGGGGSSGNTTHSTTTNGSTYWWWSSSSWW